MGNPNEERPSEKLKELEKALEIAINSENISEIFHLLLNLGKLCYEIKAYELGLKYIQEAIELGKKNPASKNLHEFYKLLGDFKFKDGMLDEANEAYNTSIKKTPKNKISKILAKSFFNLGRVNYHQDKLKQAISHFKKAEKIYEELRLHAEQAKVCNQIGLMYMNKMPKADLYQFGKYIYRDSRGGSSLAKAIKYFKKAKEILKENNLEEIESLLYNSIQSNLTSQFRFRRLRFPI